MEFDLVIIGSGPRGYCQCRPDAKVAAANAINGNVLRSNYHKVPTVIHSALKIAAVGLTEDLAERAGFAADVARCNFGGSGKARAHPDYEGFIEVVLETAIDPYTSAFLKSGKEVFRPGIFASPSKVKRPTFRV
ncbi:MAG: hypothetical protein ACYCTW_04695 [Sulfuricella sp.]